MTMEPIILFIAVMLELVFAVLVYIGYSLHKVRTLLDNSRETQLSLFQAQAQIATTKAEKTEDSSSALRLVKPILTMAKRG